MVEPYMVVNQFEKELAEYAGAPYAVAVDSCTNALLLSLVYRDARRKKYITIPCRTYPSVPCAIIHAGSKPAFQDIDWKGVYELDDTMVIDGAKRFRRGMYDRPGTLHCLSFHAKKLLPIGRGGAILTDDRRAYLALRKLRFDGRDECPLALQKTFSVGYNCYMTPEQAARGLQLLSVAADRYLDQTEEPPYPDLSLQECYR